MTERRAAAALVVAVCRARIEAMTAHMREVRVELAATQALMDAAEMLLDDEEGGPDDRVCWN